MINAQENICANSNCNKRFSPNVPWQRFCSLVCKNEFWKKHAKRPLKEWQIRLMNYEAELNKRLETDIAWLAGIIDGEGCISLWRGQEKRLLKNPSWCPFRYRPGLVIYNTNRFLIDKAARIIGEGVGLKVYLTGPYKNNHKAEYHLAVYGGYRLEPLLKKVLPYLIAKKEQAEIILQWIQTRRRAGRLSGQNHVGGRAHYSIDDINLVERIRKLNKRGVD